MGKDRHVKNSVLNVHKMGKISIAAYPVANEHGPALSTTRTFCGEHPFRTRLSWTVNACVHLQIHPSSTCVLPASQAQ